MKTIVVFSDLHYETLPERLKSVALESDYVFFLGDGCIRLGDLLFHEGLVAVKGNCDDCNFKREDVVEIEGVKILATHGDMYGVKRDLLSITLRAKELDCGLVLYGHTHYAMAEDIDGLTLINPGAIHSPAIGTPTYAYIVINEGKITHKIVNIY